MTIRTFGLALAAALLALSAPAIPGSAEAAPSSRAHAAASGHSAKPPGYRSARYRGGDGSTWRSGRDSHGFQGSYGGCRYVGNAGPGGFKLDRACR